MFEHLLNKTVVAVLAAVTPPAYAAEAENLVNLRTSEGGIHEVRFEAFRGLRSGSRWSSIE